MYAYIKYHYYVAPRALYMCVISQITYVSPFTHMHIYHEYTTTS